MSGMSSCPRWVFKQNICTWGANEAFVYIAQASGYAVSAIRRFTSRREIAAHSMRLLSCLRQALANLHIALVTRNNNSF